MGFLGIPLDMSTVLVCSVALGLIDDDTVHFLSRFQRELEASGSFSDSVRQTLLTCGKSAAMTSAILAVGFSVLLIGDFTPVIHIGKLLILIIATGLAFDLFFLPAFLLFSISTDLASF
jgi:predicted RND superfamily exporter protein